MNLPRVKMKTSIHRRQEVAKAKGPLAIFNWFRFQLHQPVLKRHYLILSVFVLPERRQNQLSPYYSAISAKIQQTQMPNRQLPNETLWPPAGNANDRTPTLRIIPLKHTNHTQGEVALDVWTPWQASRDIRNLAKEKEGRTNTSSFRLGQGKYGDMADDVFLCELLFISNSKSTQIETHLSKYFPSNDHIRFADPVWQDRRSQTVCDSSSSPRT